MEKATLVRIFCPVKYDALAIGDSERDIKTSSGRLDKGKKLSIIFPRSFTNWNFNIQGNQLPINVYLLKQNTIFKKIFILKLLSGQEHMSIVELSNSGSLSCQSDNDYLAGTDKVERENISKHLLNMTPMKKELPDARN